MKKIGDWLPYFLFTLMFLFSSALLAQDVKLSAELDRDTVELGDSFTLSIEIESSGSVEVETPELPALDNFLVVNQSTSSSQQIQFINGKVQSRRNLIYSFELQANAEGDLKIPAVAVNVDGKTLRTKELSLRVVAPGSLPDGGRGQARKRGLGNSPFGAFPGLDEDPFSALLGNRNRVPPPSIDDSVKLNPNEAFQVRVLPDKEEVYVGEQLTARYYIYVPRQYLLTSFDAVKYPNLKGFWKEDLEIAQNIRWESVVVGGQAFNRALLASYALFPIKEGVATLDEYKVKCDMAVSGFLGQGKPRSYTKSSLPVRVKVKPLPLEGRPSNFTGAVGSYQMQASLGTETLKAHQPFSYRLKIEGVGNAKSIELPDLQLPTSLELFDQKDETQFFKDGRSFKEYTLYLIPRNSGELRIPELRMGVFNPQKGAYEEIKSGEIVVTIAEGQRPEGQNLSQAQVAEPAANVPEPQIFPFAYEKSPASLVHRYGATSNAVLAVFLVLGLLLQAKRDLAWGSQQAKILQHYQQRYKKLVSLNNKNALRDFGAEATNCIYAILNLCLEDIESGAELEKALEKLSPQLRSEIGDDLKKSLRDFQTLAFAPEEVLAPYQDKKKRQEMLKVLDKILRQLIDKHEA